MQVKRPCWANFSPVPTHSHNAPQELRCFAASIQPTCWPSSQPLHSSQHLTRLHACMHASVCVQAPQQQSQPPDNLSLCTTIGKLHSATHQKRLPHTLGLACDTAPMCIQHFVPVNCSMALPMWQDLDNTDVPLSGRTTNQTTNQTTADGCHASNEVGHLLELCIAVVHEDM